MFSPKTTLSLLIILTVGIAAATFIEDKYDTVTAQKLIYKAWWFELILLLLVLNFIGNIKRYHLLSKGKIGGLLFHLGFVLLIIGAAITRYFGFEGTMHIREGESANEMYSSDPYLQVTVSSPRGTFSESYQLSISRLGNNEFNYTVQSGDEQPVKIGYNRFLRNAEEEVKENVSGGTDMIALQISAENLKQGVYLKQGERINTGGVLIAFADTAADNDVVIHIRGDKLIATAKEEIISMNMSGDVQDTIQKGEYSEVSKESFYKINGVVFTLIDYFKKAELDFKEVPDDGHNHGMEVLALDIVYNGQKQKVNLTEAATEQGQGQEVKFGDLKVNVKYGPRIIEVPFSLMLKKFVLERYAGSMSPSSFASEVIVQDIKGNNLFSKRIYMNHVLDYQGYRFFQSSYDTDEKGTILSVNHDFWGTWVSYISYFLLLLGFLITILSRHSRYHFLSAAIRKLRERRKTLLCGTILLVSGLLQAQEHVKSHTIELNESEKLGRVIVQTYDGRLEPLHTLAFDAMHKIAKKDQFSFDGKPTMDAMAVMVDMIVDPEYWKRQKMIYVREKSVGDVIGVDGKYASFNDFLNEGSQYKLSQLVEEAFRKSPAQQNAFDKELIKVDERVNLYFMMLQGSLMKIFPVERESKKWIDWNDSLALQPLKGTIEIINKDLQLKEFNYSGILRSYFQSLMAGYHSGDFSQSEKILGYIKDIQKNNILADKFPSESKISAEIKYNKRNIFNKLKGYYALVSILLILFAFMSNLGTRHRKWLGWCQAICIGLLVFVFLYHTYGMGLRWYLAGHAPWSNGYETLLLVAWSVVLAGFFFIKNSTIVQAATAFLASMILMTAGHSNYDPQLTNLQPVLQSYWLIIHVAVITISYGFLALGFILGIVNMFLYLFKSSKNSITADLLINELTFINEKNLQIGLFLATMGTFLGGIWANESWGRYWGWDAKETWALIIIIVYSIIAHLRLVPQLRGTYIFNVSSILGFGTVIMTFVGVNYYLSKGLHSYASDEKSIFPLWGWVVIAVLIALIAAAGIKEIKANKGKARNGHA